MFFPKLVCFGARCSKLYFSRSLTYKQGQYISPKIREYFYFIDHNGQVNISFVYSVGRHKLVRSHTALLPIIAGYQLPPDKIQIDLTKSTSQV